jgi:serine/threonine protein phosphatase PrpC
VGARTFGDEVPWRFGGSSFVLGTPQPVHRVAVEEHTLDRRAVLALYSDGLRSGVSLEEEPSLLREHPIVIAQRIAERFARDDDDVTVLVVG